MGLFLEAVGQMPPVEESEESSFVIERPLLNPTASVTECIMKMFEEPYYELPVKKKKIRKPKYEGEVPEVPYPVHDCSRSCCHSR